MDSLTQDPHTLFCLLINTVSTESILLKVNVLMFIGLYVVGNEDSSGTALLLAQNKWICLAEHMELHKQISL
jgi:hypothetical protein